jgi:predicted secreted protein
MLWNTRVFTALCAAALAIVMSAVGVVSARAGNFAERAFLGFSLDGRYFAFEQFGIQDGSGFPFSEIFVIDLVEDEWVAGTPVRVRIDDETASMAEARRQSHDQVRPVLQQRDIRHPGRLIASAPVTELYQDPYELSFRRYWFDTTTTDVRTALLQTLDMPTPTSCQGLGVAIKGFSLTVRNDTSGTVSLVHQDNSVPSSRSCPLDYGISDIVAYPAFDNAQVMVALINVLSYGFEGSDRRFIAIKLPTP